MYFFPNILNITEWTVCFCICPFFWFCLILINSRKAYHPSCSSCEKTSFRTCGLLKGEPLPSLCSASTAPPGRCRWKKFFFLRSLWGLCGLWGLLEIFIRVFERALGRGGVKLAEVLLIPEKRERNKPFYIFFQMKRRRKKLCDTFLRTMFLVCLGCSGWPCLIRGRPCGPRRPRPCCNCCSLHIGQLEQECTTVSAFCWMQGCPHLREGLGRRPQRTFCWEQGCDLWVWEEGTPRRNRWEFEELWVPEVEFQKALGSAAGASVIHWDAFLLPVVQRRGPMCLSWTSTWSPCDMAGWWGWLVVRLGCQEPWSCCPSTSLQSWRPW